MNKKSDQRLMKHVRLPARNRRIAYGVLVAVVSSLALSACTTYRPLDKGARVPWAKALSSGEGGPIAGNRYRVEKGDALSGIAAEYDVRLSTLAAANNIEPPYLLYPGEVLRIPEDAPMPVRRPEIMQAALPPAEPAAPSSTWNRQAASEPGIEGKRYVVSSGESLALIAVRHDLTLGELVSVNDIEPPYRITPGQVLIIPENDGPSGNSGVSEPKERAVAAMAPAPPLSADGFLWPVNGDLIGRFEQNSVTGRSGGVNIRARKGTPVRASENGIVAYAGEALSGYGRMVMLRHADGYVTLYAHNDVILVGEGDVVGRGEPIAEVGDSGDVTESQLHFELRKGKAPLDPTKVLAGLPGRQVGTL